MGGRGTFAAGNPVAYTYEVDTKHYPGGKFNGVKVLVGKDGSQKHGLPESAHSSTAYLKMNRDGSFNTLRVYDAKHNLRLEIAYHHEDTLAKKKTKILHYHIYSTDFSQTANGTFQRSTHILHKGSRIYKQYRKLLKGVIL
jgi:hypothetical protein